MKLIPLMAASLQCPKKASGNDYWSSYDEMPAWKKYYDKLRAEHPWRASIKMHGWKIYDPPGPIFKFPSHKPLSINKLDMPIYHIGIDPYWVDECFDPKFSGGVFTNKNGWEYIHPVWDDNNKPLIYGTPGLPNRKAVALIKRLHRFHKGFVFVITMKDVPNLDMDIWMYYNEYVGIRPIEPQQPTPHKKPIKRRKWILQINILNRPLKTYGLEQNLRSCKP